MSANKAEQSGIMMPNCKTTARKWGTGFVAATLLAWLVAAQFAGSISPYQYDESLDEYVLTPGTTLIKCDEGWAETAIGKHGLLDIEERQALSNRPKIILWGDSHVEAHQVADKDKPSSAYNRIASEDDPFCVNRGQSGLSVADYYFKLDKTEKLLPGVVGHAILISGMKDVLPDRQTQTHAWFHHSPWRLEPGTNRPSQLALRFGSLAYTLKVRPLYDVGKKLLSQQLRFTPGFVGKASASSATRNKNNSEGISYEDGWNFLLKQLKQKTDGYIFFIYCPYTPFLRNGHVITADPEAPLLQRFKEVCHKNGIDIIDMTRPFIELYEKENRLPRGFFNTPPGKGHLNEAGHRLIGQAMYDYIQRREK